MKTGKIILALSAIALAVGGYFYFKKPSAPKTDTPPNPDGTKADSTTSTESNNIVPPKNLPPVIVPTSPKPNPPATTTTYAYVKTDVANVYKTVINPNGSATIGSVLRTAKKNDKVGVFVGYRDVNGNSYVLLKDVNSGLPVLVLKALTEIKL